MTATDWHPRHSEWYRATPQADREHCSSQCRNGGHNCDGYFAAGGSAFGYDTYRCLCACHLVGGAA